MDAVSGGALWSEQASDEAIVQSIIHQQQKTSIGARQMPRAGLEQGVSFYIPPQQAAQQQTQYYAPPPQQQISQVQYADTSSIFNNRGGGYGQPQQQGGYAAPPTYADLEVIMPGWNDLAPDKKQGLVEGNIAAYKQSLVILNKDLTSTHDARMAVEDEELTKKYQAVLNSQRIEELLDGCAIPSYARVVAKTIPTISVNFTTNSSFILYDYSKFVQVADLTFKSFNAYGQGKVVPVKYDATLTPVALGNLSNTFICKITLKHLRNSCDVPVSVEFGETHGGKFCPYTESMLHRTPGEGVRCHFVVPPKYKGDCDFVVLTNSKEVDSPFAYLYSSLTADDRIIRSGEIGNEIQEGVRVLKYDIDHPITRYVATEGIKEGWTQYKIEDKAPNVAIIRKSVVDRAVERIREMVLQKFPTRDLSKFTIRMTRITKAGMEPDPDFAKVQTTVPFYMTFEMLYLFRDSAEQQTMNLRGAMR